MSTETKEEVKCRVCGTPLVRAVEKEICSNCDTRPKRLLELRELCDDTNFTSYSRWQLEEAIQIAEQAHSQLAQLTRERDALREALIDVLNTGLNGGNDVRLAYIAASQNALTPDLLAKAEASEVACKQARSALAMGKEK